MMLDVAEHDDYDEDDSDDFYLLVSFSSVILVSCHHY